MNTRGGAVRLRISTGAIGPALERFRQRGAQPPCHRNCDGLGGACIGVQIARQMPARIEWHVHVR